MRDGADACRRRQGKLKLANKGLSQIGTSSAHAAGLTDLLLTGMPDGLRFLEGF
jgi:hypothetical protein